MPDDRLELVYAVDERIDIDDFFDLRDWSNRFGVAKWRLREAVLAVGDSAQAVETYLRTSSQRRTDSRRVVYLGNPPARR